MNTSKDISPYYLFEVSWEVCNKVGGIHTVIATKALNMAKELENRHVLIGPDVWRETAKNPEFLEDTRLLRSWRDKAVSEGLRLRVGRWNVAGNPVVVLVDFTTFIGKKDEIFTRFWERFQLDSISGQWDYVEPALFGYAAGKVIESYVRFNLASHHKVVAQFHEWMTGTGLLYLKTTRLPVATVFTSHATVLGRCIACNNLPLYEHLEQYDPDEKAHEYNVRSKHSLEKTAAHQADAFTTVSEITARECRHFLNKEVDMVTPNGFENTFTPSLEEFPVKIKAGRSKLREIAQSLLGFAVSEDAFYVGISGRYEFKNKGIDVFLEALGRLNYTGGAHREVLAFIMIPANHNGPNRETNNHQSTHYLADPEQDPVLCRLKELALSNRREDAVKVFFLPCYLDGRDGVINTPYYDLLVGLDLSVFPSYYEPWGYTPLESIAFKVPTVTTSVAGFGLYVKNNYTKAHPGIEIIERNDTNTSYVVDAIVKRIASMTAMGAEELLLCKENAKEVSAIALWEHQVWYYKQAYETALGKLVAHISDFPPLVEEKAADAAEVSRSFRSEPNWSQVNILKRLPAQLDFLDVLSRNLWWSWNEDARALFASIDEKAWEAVEHNPILLLDAISLKNYQRLEQDASFIARLKAVEEHFYTYMSAKEKRKGPKIAYFSMEYGLDRSLRIYSGGLGVLAGDYLKESSDKEVNITAVGLLYRYGYFTQKLSAQGDQVAQYEASDFTKIPAVAVRDKDGKWATVSIALPGRNLYAHIWRVEVGRTDLYLLDTDFEDNLPEDRTVTHQLYGGDRENRLKQEILLGVGGIRALRLLNVEADVYHCNEGHAAFIGLERLREYVTDYGLLFTEAREVVRSSSLFTTHTPVPAGHDAFSEDLLRTYMGHYPALMKTTWEVMMALGKANPSDPDEKFSMSFLAANLSQEINGVSRLHGEVSRKILAPLFPGYLTEEVPVGYVTNGVHYPTWTAPEWKAIHTRVFGEAFLTHHYDKSCFKGIYKVPDQEIWDVRNRLRTKLIDTIIRSAKNLDQSAPCYSPYELVSIREHLRADILTIGFARRFATYKRAHLLFSDLSRLNAIVNNEARPVQFIFAGKAHPADKAGQGLIKRIIEVSRLPQFIGKIIFMPNYDMEVAKLLIQGVDIWLNTPTRPLEASGTSGEKASMNGVMHFSVLDGWWVEGYKKGAGWALPEERFYDNQSFQDELDAVTLYNLLEDEIVPLFYDKDARGIPVDWVQEIKNTIALVAGNFTTNRMLNDYEEKYYFPLYKSYHQMIEDDFALAKDRAFWKKQVLREWKSIEVVSYTHPTDIQNNMMLGKACSSEVVLHLGDLSPRDVGVETVVVKKDNKGQYEIKLIAPYDLVSYSNGIATYRSMLVPQEAGQYLIDARVYAKNDKLPHRQDFPLVKWV